MSHLTPYLCVADSRAAMDWYAEVFQGHREGQAIHHGRRADRPRRTDHRRLAFDDGGRVPRGERRAPDPRKGSAVSLHLEVPDCDAVAAAAVRKGVRLDRGPESTSYGRSATFRDPYGYRWIVNS